MTGKRAAERVLAQYVNDGSCVRLRAGHRHHVRAYGFVQARTHEGRSSRMLIRWTSVVSTWTRCWVSSSTYGNNSLEQSS